MYIISLICEFWIWFNTNVCVCFLLLCFEEAHTSDDETCQTRILKSIRSLIIYSAAAAHFTAVYCPWNSNPSDLYGKSSYYQHPHFPFISFPLALLYTGMRRLTTGIRSEKCVVRAISSLCERHIVYLHKPR
jgi:hypothetical protein